MKLFPNSIHEVENLYLFELRTFSLSNYCIASPEEKKGDAICSPPRTDARGLHPKPHQGAQHTLSSGKGSNCYPITAHFSLATKNDGFIISFK